MQNTAVEAQRGERRGEVLGADRAPKETPDALERARQLAPLVRAASQEVEQNGTMPEGIVKLLADADLFWTLVPQELGGLGADILTALAVTEEVSAADGSTGWSLMANMSVTGFSGGHCTDAGVDVLFRQNGRSVIAGMFAPMGTATPVEGGYVAQGTYSFGSGTGHAHWIGGGARLQEDGGVVELIYLVPRDQVDFQGNWDVVGLVGTGSYDYRIPESFVSSDLTVRRLGAKALRGQPTQRLGLQIMGSAGHAGVAMGIARRAFEELNAVLSAGKGRPGVLPIIDQQLFQHDFALHEGKLAAARSFCFDVFGAALDTVNAGDEYTELQYQRIRQASTLVTRLAYEAVEFAYLWSGSKGLREPGAIGRCMRDMHAATQHVYVDPTTLVNSARPVLASYTAR